LTECLEKIKVSECKYFILNFRDVTDIDKIIYRDLVQIQATIRNKKKCALKVCGIKPMLKIVLCDNGIIRADEVTDNVRVALIAFSQLAKKEKL